LNGVGPDGSVAAHLTKDVGMHPDLCLRGPQRDTALYFVAWLDFFDAGQEGAGIQSTAIVEGVQHGPACGLNLGGEGVLNVGRGQPIAVRHGFLRRRERIGKAGSLRRFLTSWLVRRLIPSYTRLGSNASV